MTDLITGCIFEETVTVNLVLETCCSDDSVAPLHVYDGQYLIIDTDQVFYNDIIVHSGGRLRFSNCTVQFSSNSNIIVQTGGRLSTAAATLTAIEGCGELWGGIDAWGNNFTGQDSPANQSLLRISNSEISFAKTAIFCGVDDGFGNAIPDTGGAMLGCSHDLFLNNETDILYSHYTFSQSGNQNSLTNYSKFYNCEFSLTDNYSHYNGNFPFERVRLDRCSGLGFYGCDWNNSNDLLINDSANNIRFAAIRSTNSQFYVEPGVYDVPSTFNNFVYGIWSSGSVGDNITVIDNATFNCFRGAYFRGSPSLLQVSKSRFFSAPTTPLFPDFGNQSETTLIFQPFNWEFGAGAYGLYIQAPNRIIVEENHFEMGNNDFWSTGLLVRENFDNANEIYFNVFQNNSVGAKFYFRNRGGLNEGLKYSCNDFIDNNKDIEINANSTSPQNGVAQFQGDPFSSAKNTMNLFTPQDDDEEIVNWTDNTHVYFYNQGELEPNEVMGQVMTPVIDLSGCSSNFKSMVELEDDKTEAINSYAVKKNEWNALVDGGDTESLTEEVIHAEFSEALTLYYKLMAQSPNLSEKVMIEAIEKEFDLPMVLLKQILKSNPQAAKSKKIESKLDQRLMPLPDYMREEIKEGLEWVSQKEILESEITSSKQSFITALNHQVSTMLRDTIITNPDSLINTLPNINEIETTFYQRMAAASHSVYPVQHLDELLVTEDLTIAEQEEVTLTKNVALISKNLTEGTLTWNSSTESELMNIAINGNSLAAPLAQSEIEKHTNKIFMETTQLPAVLMSLRSYLDVDDKKEELTLLHLYPNPTADLLIIEKPELPLTETAEYIILNSYGQTVMKIKATSGIQEYIDVRQLGSGRYSLSLYDMNELLTTSSFIKK